MKFIEGVLSTMRRGLKFIEGVLSTTDRGVHAPSPCAQGLSVARTDVHALTPLHQATLGKNAAMVDMLLRAG